MGDEITQRTSAELLDRAQRLKEPLMIRGDRLLWALDMIHLVWGQEGSGYNLDNESRALLERARITMRNCVGSGNTFPPLECIYLGRHRGGESIGLARLRRILRPSRGLEQALFCWDALSHVFLEEWERIAPERELVGLFRWMCAAAAGELTKEASGEVE